MFDGPKRAGTKFDSIGQLNMTRHLDHSRGSARFTYQAIKPNEKVSHELYRSGRTQKTNILDIK